MVATTLLDALSTVYGFANGFGESNVVIVELGSHIGLIEALFVAKLVSALFIYGMLEVTVVLDGYRDRDNWYVRSAILSVFAIGYLLIAIRNLLLIEGLL